MTKTLEMKIDGLHRRLLRKAGLQESIKCEISTQIISNEEVYRRTKAEKWSNTVKKRRLGCLGHLLRLPTNTPARIALMEACKTSKKNPGRSKTIWLDVITSDIRQSTLTQAIINR